MPSTNEAEEYKNVSKTDEQTSEENDNGFLEKSVDVVLEIETEKSSDSLVRIFFIVTISIMNVSKTLHVQISYFCNVFVTLYILNISI